MVLLRLKKVPKSCNDCAISCGLKYHQVIDDKRHKLCPIVTDHGRIIDADKFLEKCLSYAVTDADRDFCRRLTSALDKAEIIIDERHE